MGFLRPGQRGFATFACLSAAAITISSVSLALIGSADGIKTALKDYSRRIRSNYTVSPTKPYLGEHPGRTKDRGGVWKNQALADAAASPNPLWAASNYVTLQAPPDHTLSVDGAPGPTYPWEGSTPVSAGSLNTGNGNKLTTIPLFSWKTKGGGTLDFTLYHNSQTNYAAELGNGFSWSYELYINNLTGNPVVHYGNGLSIPYTSSGGGTTGSTTGGIPPGGCLLPAGPRADDSLTPTFTPPAGIYDQLVENTGSTWTLTTKDKTVYQFNTAGFCTSMTDRNGNAITFTLNSSNYVTKVTDPTGRSYSFTFDTSSRYTSVTDSALSRTWSFTYNSSNELQTITWPSLGDGNTYTDQFTYVTEGTNYDIATHTDRRGKVWTSTYNSDGSLASEEDPNSHTTTYTYASGSTTLTDPLSHTEVDNYSSGLRSSHVDESSFSESFTSYDANNNVLTLVDQNGKTWTYTYDSLGNTLTVEDPLSHTTTYTYNSFSEPLTVTDPLSHVTTYTYDTNGNRLTTVDALSHTTETNTYLSGGLLYTKADALGHTTTLGYDTNGDATTILDPLSHTTTLGYDAASRITSVEDPLSHTESTTYNAWDRPIQFTHPDGYSTFKAYDAAGNLTTVTDENSHASTYTYDPAGRLTNYSNPRGDSEVYGYDTANRRTTVENGRGYTRTYTFTNRGEVATLTMPDSSEEQWAYDGLGHTTAYENPLSQTIDYTFDNAGRETAIDYPTGTDTTFTYDNADRRTGMVDSIGTTTWGFDNADRLTSLDTPQGNISYTLDNAGRRTAMTEPAGSWSYGYDNDNHLTSQENPASETTAWTYDAAGRKTGQTFANGQVDTYGYDTRDRETSVTHKNSSGTTISAETYVLDPASNLTSKTVGSTTTSYTYDNADQLLSETAPSYSESFTYDANGNRATATVGGVSQTYNVDDGDKLNSITSGGTTLKSYTYDAAGRTKTVVTSAGTTSLSYDYEDRVSGITYPSSATNSFTYNGLDTRVSKVDSTGTYSFVRDGVGVTAPVLEDGHANYTQGVSRRASSATTFDNLNYLGSSTLQTNSSQATTATRTFDAFGNLVASTGTPVGPFGFVGSKGYQADSDSGLMLLGHRYYDPSTGRFITRDSIESGRNWYNYCDNNPGIAIDPLGYQGSRQGPWPNPEGSWYPGGFHLDPNPARNHEMGPHFDWQDPYGIRPKERLELPVSILEARDPITGKMPGDSPDGWSTPIDARPYPYNLPPSQRPTNSDPLPTPDSDSGSLSWPSSDEGSTLIEREGAGPVPGYIQGSTLPEP